MPRKPVAVRGASHDATFATSRDILLRDLDAGPEAVARALESADRATLARVVGRLQGERGNAFVQRVVVATQRRALVQRKAQTLGGEWDTDTYTTINDGTQDVGVDIDLKFVPQDPAESPKIGLTQMANTTNNGTPLAINPTVSGRSIPSGKPGAGSHIDHLATHGNPFYATNKPSAGDTLASTPTKREWGQHGWHYKEAGGAMKHQDAHLKDSPQLSTRGANASQTFETAALAVEGSQTGTYYGSVRWGWQTDAAGAFTRLPLSVASVGEPSPTFMKAAELWNAGKTSEGVNTIPLPVGSGGAGTVAPAGMSTIDLVHRLQQVDADLAKLPPGVDKTNREFEKKALDAELAKRPDKPTTTSSAEATKAAGMKTVDILARLDDIQRDAGAVPAGPGPDRANLEVEKDALTKELDHRNVKVDVKVVKTEGWFTADKVYVKLIGGAGKTETAPIKLNNGDSHTYSLALAPLLPLVKAPLTVEVWDHDLLDPDDLIVKMDWPSPYAKATNTSSLSGANYNVTAEFDK